MQPPSPGAQPPTPPPSAQQPDQRGVGGPIGQPPRPSAPQQPVGTPAIAPSALQPPAPPPGSPAAQAQRQFVPPPAQDSARRLDDVRGARREVREGDRVMIQEPGRVIIREGGRTIIRHSETDRFRWQARDVRVERRGADTVTVFERPDGSRLYTETDESGRLLRRYRRAPDGREIIIIDNRYGGPPRVGGYFVDLPPPVIRIPRERYIVDARYARPDDIYYALWAAPVAHIERPYTLDEICYSPSLRERMPRVDLDTVTFDTGSWEVTPDQVEHLAVIADGINRAIAVNPSEVFLIAGHTDAVGSDVDNLSLSDRRAESGGAGAQPAVRGARRESHDPRLRRAVFESSNAGSGKSKPPGDRAAHHAALDWAERSGAGGTALTIRAAARRRASSQLASGIEHFRKG